MAAHQNNFPKTQIISSCGRRARFVKYWLPVIIYAILIFCLSSVPGRNIPKLFTGQNTFFHIIEYGFFAFLINRALKTYYPYFTFIRRFAWVFFLSFAYAVSDEFHQMFVPGRFTSTWDLFTDGLGSFVGGWFSQWQR